MELVIPLALLLIWLLLMPVEPGPEVEQKDLIVENQLLKEALLRQVEQTRPPAKPADLGCFFPLALALFIALAMIATLVLA